MDALPPWMLHWALASFVAAGLGCAGSAPAAPPAPAPVATLSPGEAEPAVVDFCPEERLFDFAEELGAQSVESEPFVGEMLVGSPVSRRVARCDIGQTEEECIARVAPEVPEGHVARLIGIFTTRGRDIPLVVDGVTEVVRTLRVADVDERVEALRAEGHQVTRGDARPVGRVLREELVCVSIRAQAVVQMSQVRAIGVLGIAALVGNARNPDLWVEMDGDDLMVRCRPEDEPPARSDGPCAELTDERRIARGRRETSCDDPNLGPVRFVRTAQGGTRVYGVALTNILHARVGLMNGDAIMSICGQPYADQAQLVRALRERPAGCVIDVVRRAAPISLDIAAACR